MRISSSRMGAITRAYKIIENRKMWTQVNAFLPLHMSWAQAHTLTVVFCRDASLKSFGYQSYIYFLQWNEWLQTNLMLIFFNSPRVVTCQVNWTCCSERVITRVIKKLTFWSSFWVKMWELLSHQQHHSGCHCHSYLKLKLLRNHSCKVIYKFHLNEHYLWVL